ncbi:MAG: SEC-C domain-containing protein, partial [Candidatus Omnitrophica bacterium]|nr:SEC-C domain-containing protein [Candidatus Omnitrophota bacterium]
VMNQQREIIYQRRRKVILGTDLNKEVFDVLGVTINDWLYAFEEEGFLEELSKKLLFKLLISVKADDLRGLSREELFDKIYDAAKVVYEKREKIITSEKVRYIEKMIMLGVIDANWKDYLFNMDQLREGINWRAYGQRDPLVEYQHEAFAMFSELIKIMDEEIIERLFKTHAIEEKLTKQVFKVEKERFIHEEYSALSQPPKVETDRPIEGLPASEESSYERKGEKIGRNAPCPCGSGKKYKKCCGK